MRPPRLLLYLPDAAALACLAAFCALLMRATLLRGGAMLGYDLYTYFFPAKTYAAAALWRGELPLWNPYVFFGAPFLANVQMAVLYPPDLVFDVLSFPRAVAVSQWLHLLLAGYGMYTLCRRGWGLDATAGLVGGLAFAGSGFFGAHMGHLNQVHAGAWLPWIALAASGLAETLGRGQPGRALPWLVGGGAAVALQATAGHTQEAYYSLLAVGLLAAGYTLFPPARAPVRWTHLAALGALALDGAFLAAAQLVPAAELARLSYRQGGVSFEEAAASAVERMHILETVLPTFWSLPSQEVTGYVGVTVVPLILAALGLSPARRTVLGLAALALLALTLSLGAYTPLYAALYRVVPLFDAFRVPGRWLFVSTFALAGLAAHGAGALRRGVTGEEREGQALRYGVALTAAAGLLLFFLWRSNEVRAVQWLPHARVAVLWGAALFGATALGLLGLFARPGWPRLVLVAGLALELGGAAREMEYNQPGPPDLYAKPPAVADYLHGLMESGPLSGLAAPLQGAPAVLAAPPAAESAPAATDRVLSIAVEERLDRDRLRGAVPGEDATYRHYAAMREVLKTGLGLVYGLPTVDGYDGGLLPTADYARFKSLLVTGQPPVPHFTLPPQLDGRADAALLGALNVRFLLTDGRQGPPGKGWLLRDGAPGAAWLYENPDVRPRAYLVSEVAAAPGGGDAAERALAGLDLDRQALVSGPAGALPAVGPAGLTRRAAITRYSAGALEIETETDAAALLVLSDSYYPGWRATLDGREVPVWRTDLLFRGVPVPPGAHRVRFWFDPLSVKLGCALSALALVANGAGLGLLARGRRLGR